MQTGLLRTNHGLDDTVTKHYYQYVRRGAYTPKLYDATTSQDHGPYEFDLALKLGAQLVAANPADATGLALLAQTAVAPTSQGTVVGRTAFSADVLTRNGYSTSTGAFTGTVGRGDSSDDLQARTGCKANWLSQAGVQRIGVFGKNQNGTGQYDAQCPTEFKFADGTGTLAHAFTNRFIPPGYTDFCCITVDDQNHVDMPTIEASNITNPGSGDGKVGTNYEYLYRYPITNMVWSSAVDPVSGTTGQITITFTNPNTNAATDIDTLIRVGDEVGIDEVVSTGTSWNFGALFVSTIVSQNSAGGVVTVPMHSALSGTLTLTNAKLCPHKMFSEQVLATKIINMLDTVDDEDSFLIQYGSRMPHWSQTVGTGSVNNAESLSCTKRYVLDAFDSSHQQYGAVQMSEFAYWKGNPGAYSPAVDPTQVTAGHKENWAQRQHMLAAVNDAVARILDYCDDRFGEQRYIVIFATDNGCQVGEQGGTFGEDSTVWAQPGGKIYVYDGSERLFLWMRHPQYAAQVVTFPTWCGDFAPTNMDLFANNVQFFGLRNHHCHQKRDAKSLLRLLDDATDPDRNRLMFGIGRYKQSSPDVGLYLYDPATQYKLLRSNPVPATRGLYDMTPDPDHPCGGSVDWETNNIDAANTSIANAMSTALDLMKKAGWDSSTQLNNVKSIRV